MGKRAPRGASRCASCHQPLRQPFGFHGTGLCGPCCTGESDTINTLTYACPACRVGVESDNAKCPACQRALTSADLTKGA